MGTLATILLVDDEPAFRSLLRKLLVEAAYDVLEADDSKGALDQIKDVAIDLVIADLVMPGMEGLELLQILRRQRPQLKIIAISAS